MSKAVRLLHVLPSFGAGGMELRMASLMNRLGPFAQHTILPLDGNSRASQNLDRSVSVSFLRSPPRRRSLTNALVLGRLIVSVDPDLEIGRASGRERG